MFGNLDIQTQKDAVSTLPMTTYPKQLTVDSDSNVWPESVRLKKYRKGFMTSVYTKASWK